MRGESSAQAAARKRTAKVLDVCTGPHKKGDAIFLVAFEPASGGGGVGGYDWFFARAHAVEHLTESIARDPDLLDSYLIRRVNLPRDMETMDDIADWLESPEGVSLWSVGE